MTVLKSVLRDIIRPVLRPILRGGDDAITRFFTDISSAGSMLYTIPTVTFTGDYQIPGLVYFTGASLPIFGNSSNDQSRCLINADGSISFRPENSFTTVSAPAGSVPLNKLSIVEVSRVSNSSIIKVNGSTVGSGGFSAGSAVINVLGSSGALDGTGIVANIGMSGDSFSSRFYPLDENFGETPVAVDTISGQNGTAVNISESDFFTLQDNGDYLGVELWTFGDYTFTGLESTFAFVVGTFSSTGLSIGNSFKWAYDFNEVNDSAGIRLRVGDVANNSPDSGSFEGIKIVTTGDDLYFQTVAGPVPGAGSTITNQSTRQILESA